MPLSIDAKRALVDEVSQVAASAQSAVAAEYRGLSVGEMTELRVQARQSDVYMKVVKNTLAKRAVEGNLFFEEYIVKVKFHDGEEASSNQAEVLVFENLKIKNLRMYFDRLDFSSSVAKDVISKTIVRQLVKKSLEGLT